MKKLLLFTGILFVFVSSPCIADILEVVTENWRPYNYMEEGEVKGFSTEIIKKILKKSGVKYNMTVLPWSRAYNMAQHEKNIMIYTIMRIPSREKLFIWGKPLGNGTTTRLYRLKSNTHINPTNLSEAKEFHIVTNQDSMDHIWLVTNGFTNLEVTSKVTHSIRMLMNERVPLLPFNSGVIDAEFVEEGYNAKNLVSVLDLFITQPFFAFSHSTSAELIRRLRQAYDDLLKDKEFILIDL